MAAQYQLMEEGGGDPSQEFSMASLHTIDTFKTSESQGYEAFGVGAEPEVEGNTSVEPRALESFGKKVGWLGMGMIMTAELVGLGVLSLPVAFQ